MLSSVVVKSQFLKRNWTIGQIYTTQIYDSFSKVIFIGNKFVFTS